MLEDVQGRRDDRQLPIDEVGITGIRYPVAVWDQEHGKQETVANFRLSVNLRADAKGAHLSRFVELLHERSGELSPQTLPAMVQDLRGRLGSRSATIEARFPYFLPRAAPVTGATALLEYECGVTGSADTNQTTTEIQVRVPVTSVCPCSKAISDYGAHNQRGYITTQVRLRHDEMGESPTIWLEDLIAMAETAASAPLFPLLKRPDERHVTMKAHDTPVFVEDMARAVASRLRQDQRFSWFAVEAINDESIHNHAAFARIQSAKFPSLATGE